MAFYGMALFAAWGKKMQHPKSALQLPIHVKANND
jgi:hypothetical protein